MSIQIAEVTSRYAPAPYAPPSEIAASAFGLAPIDECLDLERPPEVMRGIIIGVLMSIPFWTLLVFALRRLI